jgi:GxxExxY protein
MTPLSEKIIGCSIKIHKTLGPGLLESVYQKCLVYELSKLNIASKTEVLLPVKYEELNFESGFRADLIVDEKIIVEIKSMEKISQAHVAQTLTYLKLTSYPVALLINFGEATLKTGIKRFVNGDIKENL